MTCGVAVSASNYDAPLFNLLRSRSDYRSSREPLGVAFRECTNRFLNHDPTSFATWNYPYDPRDHRRPSLTPTSADLSCWSPSFLPF